MKNILSTLALIAVVGVSAVGAFFLYQRAFENESGSHKLTRAEGTIELGLRLGEPFVKAWVARDVKGLSNLTGGEFAAGIPSYVQWTTESKPPFEKKWRICTDEEQESTTDFDVFFGCLLDPISGLENIQTEFSVLKAIDYSDRFDNMWDFRLLLRATGINENGGVTTFRLEQDVTVVLPDRDSEVRASFHSWQIFEEDFLTSNESVMEQIYGLLSKQGIEVLNKSFVGIDVADLDGDEDTDIAITLPGGISFVFEFDNQVYMDVTESLGITSGDVQGDGQDLTRTVWLDYNDDGYPDLISGPRMFENQNGKKFVDVTAQLGLEELLRSTDINSMGFIRAHLRSE